MIVFFVVRLPEISNYWKQSGVMEVSWFRSIFTRKRFYDILKYLHLAVNTNTPEKTDPNYKLHKLGGIIELLSLFQIWLHIMSANNNRWANDWDQSQNFISSVYAQKAQEVWGKTLDILWSNQWVLPLLLIVQRKVRYWSRTWACLSCSYESHGWLFK